MSMHRRPVGRPRALAALGALVILAGCVIPWWTVGGSNGLPARSGNAFDAMGIVVFVAALATLAIVTLPYATDRPVPTDRWLAYGIVTALGWIGFGARLLDLAFARFFSFAQPAEIITRGPGLWVVAIGLIILSRATYDIAREPDRR
jgi:hypothetical protein